MTDRRIIYVTGMKPKPPPAEHRAALVRVFSAAVARQRPELAGWLEARPERFTLVSWTTQLYDYHRDLDLDIPGIERLLATPVPSAADRRRINSPTRQLARCWHLLGDSFPLLTNLLAPPALKQTLADVRRYLDDDGGIATRIRAMLREPLLAAWREQAKVLLIGHSLGSVIAFDVLWEMSHVEREPGRVDLFLSLGSPIATRFIRHGLIGAHRIDAERYPDNIGRWINVSARGEMVALHPRVKPFFARMEQLGLVESIEDRAGIYLHFYGPAGLDVHKSYGYLNHPLVAGAAADWIAAPADAA